MTTIQIRARHTDVHNVGVDVLTSHNAGREIQPATAVTIASWWQSSGSIGSVLAEFASGATVDRSALLDDIAATRNTEGYHDGRMSESGKQALDMLATFALNYGKEGNA